MPMSRISLLKRKPPEYLRALGDSLRAAMVKAPGGMPAASLLPGARS